MKKNLAIATAMLGHALEHYEVTLYGFFAVILGPLFFPNADSTTSLIASLGIFALGFVMRPLGGLIFGHFGDKIGRRKCLLCSILVAAVPTIIIGILPTYETIGVWAPFILIICRLVQGFSLGGEYSGAMIFVAEHSSQKKIGFLGSLLCSTGYLGAILGTLMGALFTISGMPIWGWRLPFIIGGVLGLGVFFLRRNLPETPALQHQENALNKHYLPLMEVYRKRALNAFCVVLMGGSSLVPLYLASIYLNPLLVDKFELSRAQMMLVHALLLVLAGGFMPLFGHFADKVGLRKWMILMYSILCIIAFPLFSLVTSDSLAHILVLQIVMALLGSSYHSAVGGVFPSLFSPTERYSGVAFHYTLGQAIFGGTAPLIATGLVTWTGNPIAPAFYLMAATFCGVIAVFLSKPVGLSSVNTLSSKKVDEQKKPALKAL